MNKLHSKIPKKIPKREPRIQQLQRPGQRHPASCTDQIIWAMYKTRWASTVLRCFGWWYIFKFVTSKDFIFFGLLWVVLHVPWVFLDFPIVVLLFFGRRGCCPSLFIGFQGFYRFASLVIGFNLFTCVFIPCFCFLSIDLWFSSMVFSIFCVFVVHHSLVFLVSVAKWSQSQKPKAKSQAKPQPEARSQYRPDSTSLETRVFNDGKGLVRTLVEKSFSSSCTSMHRNPRVNFWGSCNHCSTQMTWV